jgi:hypothetical protein
MVQLRLGLWLLTLVVLLRLLMQLLPLLMPHLLVLLLLMLTLCQLLLQIVQLVPLGLLQVPKQLQLVIFHRRLWVVQRNLVRKVTMRI